jgi:hypothetical protein
MQLPGRFGRCFIASAQPKRGVMLKDQTAEDLWGKVSTLRSAADEAEDTCVKLRLLAHARDFERLITLVTPVLTAAEAPAAR